MANDFRITSAYYISKDGNDANSGLTADLPKQTFALYGLSHTVGTGQYKGAFSITPAPSTTAVFRADSLVKILMTANFVFGNTAVVGSIVKLNDTEGGKFLIDCGGFDFIEGSNFSSGGQTEKTRVVLRNGTGSNSGGNADALNTDCVFSDFTATYDNCIDYLFEKCMFFNYTVTYTTTTPTGLIYKNCYMDAATVINLPIGYFATPATQFLNCNMQGQFNVLGTLYELKKDRDGNAIDPNPAIADIVSIDASVYTRGNYSQDPEFLNIEKRDYKSVANTSPLLFASDDSTNIGNVKSSTLKKATDTEFASGTITDLTTDTNDFIVNSPATTGDVVSQAIQVATIAQVIESIDFAELFNFDNLQTKGTPENTNVTISNNFATTTAGANPRRLTYEMRWTDADAVPVLNADWTNNGFVTAGDYSTFEQFTKPLVDVASLGNGNPSFNPAGASPIKAKWVQFMVTMFDGIG